MRRFNLFLLAFCCLTTRAVPAVDGVIEINQASVFIGGVSPGNNPGFSVSLTVAGSYRLTGNLDVSAEASPE